MVNLLGVSCDIQDLPEERVGCPARAALDMCEEAEKRMWCSKTPLCLSRPKSFKRRKGNNSHGITITI